MTSFVLNSGVLLLVTMSIFAASYDGLKYRDLGVLTPGDWSVSWGFIMIIFSMLLALAAAAVNILAFVRPMDTA